MYFVTKNKKIVFKILSLLFILHTTLFAGNTYDEGSMQINSSYISEVKSEQGIAMNVGTQEHVEVALDSFGSMSMTIMLLLTSLLGAFFVRDEFATLLE